MSVFRTVRSSCHRHTLAFVGAYSMPGMRTLPVAELRELLPDAPTSTVTSPAAMARAFRNQITSSRTPPEMGGVGHEIGAVVARGGTLVQRRK